MNLAREGGWARYKVLTDEYSEQLEKAISKEEDSVEEKMVKFDKVHTKIKFKAIGKVSIRNKLKKHTKDDNEEAKEENAKKCYDDAANRANNEIKEINRLKTSKVGKIWEIRKRIIGGGKACIINTAIVNPDNGKLAVTKEQIKNVTLKYCKETLSKNQVIKGFESFIAEKEQEMTKKLSECDGNFEPTFETFQALVEKFKMSRKRNYDFLVRASKNFQAVVFKFSKIMIERETFPSSFQETTLHMIFKGGNGRRQMLTDNRFVHSKTWYPRTVEGLLVVQGLKEPLVNQSSMYQIGGQPSHRAEEHIFSLKSIIAYFRKQGKPVIIQSSDISKFFDKEMIQDAILTCHRRGADPKAIRCWYNLNKDTRIRVKTGAGLSEFSHA